MRALWLTTDRSAAVLQYYAALRRACEVEMAAAGWEWDVLIRPAPNPYGKWIKAIEHDPVACPPLLTGPQLAAYDFVFVDNMGAFMHESWASRRGPWATLLDDTHYPIQMRRFLKALEWGAELWPMHQHPFRRRFPGVAYRWLPFAADVFTFRPWREWSAKKPGVLLSGVIDRRWYPVRFAAQQQLRRKEWAHTILRPREVADGSTWPRGVDYAAELSRYTMALTCGSLNRHTLLKTFEIPACGTLMLSDWTPEMEELGFRDGVNFVRVNPTDRGFRKQVRRMVRNPDQIEDIAAAGLELVKSRHTIQRRAALWMEYVESAVRG